MSYGIIEYNNLGQPKCEICNKYFDVVTRHVAFSHKMSARDYKIKFGLTLKHGIVSKTMKVKFRQQGLKQVNKTPDWAKNGNRFQKGHIGRPREMMSEQARLKYMALAKALGESGIGNKIKYQGAALFHHKISNVELWTLYLQLDNWCHSYYQANYDEDITSKVICEVAKKGKFVLTVKMFTYLCAVARNMYLAKFKYERVHKTTNLDDIPNYDFAIHYPTFEDEEALATIWKCIYSLRPKQQELIIYKMQGLKNAEIEKILNYPTDYLKTLIWIARNNLKKELLKNGISPR